MVSQQAERGPFVEIGNDVMSQLIQAGLSGTEWSLTFAVIQRLRCRGGNAVSISLLEFHDLVRLDEEAIRKGLKTLRERNILVQQEPPSFIKPASWSFNENWQSWAPSGSRRVLFQHTPPQQHTESPIPAQRGVLSQHTVSLSAARPEVAVNSRNSPRAAPLPEPSRINNKKHVYRFEKNKSSPPATPTTEARVLASQLRDALRARDPKSRAGRTEDLSDWALDIELLMSADQRSSDEIRRVIDWCQSPGSFWGPHILSGKKLREKFDTLSGLMMREKCEAKYERLNGSYRVPQILNNRAEREYVPVKEPVRI